MTTFQILMSATTIALLYVLLLPWECCCVNVKKHVENFESHRESLIEWKKSVAKAMLNSVRRSSLVNKVRESRVWKKLEDLAYNEAHRYRGERHGPAIGRLLRFVKQSATDTDLWQGQMWKVLGFEEALIYDPPGYESQTED